MPRICGRRQPAPQELVQQTIYGNYIRRDVLLRYLSQRWPDTTTFIEVSDVDPTTLVVCSHVNVGFVWLLES
jgi:hypothetical protein